jgi:hypothetical protein
MFGAEQIMAANRSSQRRNAQVIPFTADNTAPIHGKAIRRQWDLICSDLKSIVAFCSRRSGKTVGIVKRVCKKSWENPGRRTLYIHHTLGNAKKQFFAPPGALYSKGLLGTLDAHGIGHTDNSTDVCTELENGSFVQVVGCDNMKQVGKKLGYFWDEVIIDEVQNFAEELIVLLVKTTLAPTLIDTHGTLVLAGTPPEVHVGFWWETLNNPTFEQFHWTMLDNPLITREAIVEEMAQAGFTVDFDHPEKNHPTVQREIFGLNVIDVESLAYCYIEVVNDWPVTGVPFCDDKFKESWRYAMGIDIGGVEEHHDRDSIVIFGWRVDDGTRKVYERESWAGRGDSHEFQQRVIETFHRWQPMQSAVCDTGGSGAVKMMAYLKPRFGGLEWTGKPTSVETSQRLFNDELRSGRMILNPLGEVAKAAKQCRKNKHELDVMAAARYAFHGAYNWLSKGKPAPKPIDQQLEEQRIARWQANERSLASQFNGSGSWGLT